ncbi:uncharacterized protein LOC135701330 [Ochlerotatus camptorhynchus]|uniref:uncharacterized protein LOC135701330 n=1 Tax=Ochlerotatus camptorhynchus TaxID=644619 RepID=UPI0031E250F8
MWKYVSRRIRDVCDRTYTVLDVRRPWQCGGERLCSENNLPGDGQQQSKDEKVPQREKAKASYCLLSVARSHLELSRERKQHYDTGSNSSDKEGFRRKEYCSFQPNWIGAITWTNAIICGWYTSQLICLYRRNHKWEGPKCLPYLISSAHKFPREFQSSHYSSCHPFSNPPPLEHAPKSQQDPQQSLVPTFLGFPIPTAKPSRLDEFDFEDLSGARRNVLFEINNDGRQQTGNQHRFDSLVVNEGRGLAAVKQQQEPKAPTVESAMENLMSVIGEIEYQLGVENLEIGDYTTAVSHLKLGTSHQHAGAAFNLGICYEQGFGVKKSARVAMECFHLASTLGHAQAMYNLGVYYARGLGGLRRSRPMAKKCFTAAADLGLEEAIVALGPSYNKQSSMSSPSGSSVSTPQPMAAPYGFKFTFDDVERYGYDAVKVPEQPEQLELRLVSAMA